MMVLYCFRDQPRPTRIFSIWALLVVVEEKGESETGLHILIELHRAGSTAAFLLLKLYIIK